MDPLAPELDADVAPTRRDPEVSVPAPARVVRAPRDPRPISLALQGGGALGAYTWGVLEALLARPDLPIDLVSGTSAGALNGAVLASALASGGRRHARDALESFWRSVAAPPSQSLFRAMMGPVGGMVTEGVRQWLFGGAMLSPYQTDPLDLNPLRQAIAAHVDVEALRARRGPQLFVTATHVRTGLPRVFGGAEISIDALLASACLPQLFRAVEVDGEPYWDGGYVGNPTLWPLVRHGRARDLVLVQLAPDRRDALPRSNAAIRQRAAEIVFNSSLVAEMQAIQALRELSPADDPLPPDRPAAGRGPGAPGRVARSLVGVDLGAARRGSRRDATIPAPRRTEAGTHVDARHRAGLRHRTQAADPPPGGRYPRSPTVKERG